MKFALVIAILSTLNYFLYRKSVHEIYGKFLVPLFLMIMWFAIGLMHEVIPLPITITPKNVNDLFEVTAVATICCVIFAAVIDIENDGGDW